MRIIGGRWKGLRLQEVGAGDPNTHLRPTTDRVRENLFNILAARVEFDGLRVLDLFAGTGALGFEALSRGAEALTLIDNGAAARRLIRANQSKLGAAAKILSLDATALAANPDSGYDLVFLDPPYKQGLGSTALRSAAQHGWLATEAWVIWEEANPQEAPDGFALLDQRQYGDTSITVLEWQGGC